MWPWCKTSFLCALVEVEQWMRSIGKPWYCYETWVSEYEMEYFYCSSVGKQTQLVFWWLEIHLLGSIPIEQSDDDILYCILYSHCTECCVQSAVKVPVSIRSNPNYRIQTSPFSQLAAAQTAPTRYQTTNLYWVASWGHGIWEDGK